MCKLQSIVKVYCYKNKNSIKITYNFEEEKILKIRRRLNILLGNTDPCVSVVNAVLIHLW